MLEGQAIKHILQDMKWDYQLLADECGYKDKSSVSKFLNGENMTTETLCKLLDALGAELIIRKGNSEYVITHDEESILEAKFDFPLNLNDFISGKR